MVFGFEIANLIKILKSILFFILRTKFLCEINVKGSAEFLHVWNKLQVFIIF